MNSTKPKSKRLLSLDVLRGITIAGMIVVNNGAGPESFEALCHSAWNGLTPCDLVFPFFLFIMGITTYLSLRKSGFTPSLPVVGKILKRSVLIILVGWAIHWFVMALYGDPWNFSSLRLTGVLPRIGFCYGVVSLLALLLSRRAMIVLAAVLLVLYTALILLFHGYDSSEESIIYIVDHAILGAGHVYRWATVDPEGLLSNLSALAHTIIGFCVGSMIAGKDSVDNKVIKIFVTGFLLTASGFLLMYWLPINKQIWSPSFTLATCGLGALLLGTLAYFIDIRGKRRWCVPFEMFGVNPLFLYVLSELLGVVIGLYLYKEEIYAALAGAVGDPRVASLLYALLFLSLMACIAYPLYRRRIYIKL